MAQRILVSDIDGTLVARGQPLGRSVLGILRGLEATGWRIMLLTGQPFSNIRKRLGDPAGAPALTLYTCEGARRRMLCRGEWRIDRAHSAGFRIPPYTRRRLCEILSRPFINSILGGALRVVDGPLWWEGALLVFRVAGRLESRIELARALEAALAAAPRKASSWPELRVGIAGKTTIVVGLRDATKARVLTDLVISVHGDGGVVFLADEFAAPGNDSGALTVNGLVRIGVSPESEGLGDLVAFVGRGPTAASRFLRELTIETRNSRANPEAEARISAERCRNSTT